MAQIKTLTYSRTINLGNYESERLEATVELESRGRFSDGREDTEDPTKAFKDLKEWVLTQVYGGLPTEDLP